MQTFRGEAVYSVVVLWDSSDGQKFRSVKPRALDFQVPRVRAYARCVMCVQYVAHAWVEACRRWSVLCDAV